MQLSEMRAAVRTQLELEEVDLPNSDIDLFLREAFQRTIQREQRWRFLEYEWAVTSLTNGQFLFPANLSGLSRVMLDNVPLVHISHDLAKQTFSTTTNGQQPRYFSLWNGVIYAWPNPGEETTITLGGWRIPDEFALPGASAASVPDCDSRLHLPLVHYACSRVYARQEDEILERTYLDSWNNGVELARADILRPMWADQLILNQGLVL